MDNGKIAIRNNRVFIVTSYLLSNEPTEILQFWPVVLKGGLLPDPVHFRQLEGVTVTYSPSPTYCYNLRDLNTPTGWVYFYLPDRGQTKCEIERRPVSCPKVRAGIETRWSTRGWEKYLKTKGWVIA